MALLTLLQSVDMTALPSNLFSSALITGDTEHYLTFQDQPGTYISFHGAFGFVGILQTGTITEAALNWDLESAFPKLLFEGLSQDYVVVRELSRSR